MKTPKIHSKSPEGLLKICTRCKAEKLLNQFTVHAKMWDGLSCHCRSCSRELSSRSYIRDRGVKSRASHLRGTYGISIEDYERRFQEQSGVCAICGQAEFRVHKLGKVKSLAIDHDHKTGEVRGLLCHDCNSALGLMRDDAERLRRAADYLDELNAR